MKPSTEYEIAGKVHEVKGTIKEKVGELTNDPDLEGEGIGEKLAGESAEENWPVVKSPREIDFFPDCGQETSHGGRIP